MFPINNVSKRVLQIYVDYCISKLTYSLAERMFVKCVPDALVMENIEDNTNSASSFQVDEF